MPSLNLPPPPGVGSTTRPTAACQHQQALQGDNDIILESTDPSPPSSVLEPSRKEVEGSKISLSSSPSNDVHHDEHCPTSPDRDDGDHDVPPHDQQPAVAKSTIRPFALASEDLTTLHPSTTLEDTTGVEDDGDTKLISTGKYSALRGGELSDAAKSLLGAVDDSFFDDDSDSSTAETVKRSANAKRQGTRPKSGKKSAKKSPRKGRATPASSQLVMAAYKKERKQFYDIQRRNKLLSPSNNNNNNNNNNKPPEEYYTGNHHPTLRTMAEVEASRLSKGQTFQSRDILLLRTKEEANLRGISIKVEKSDMFRFICWSRDEPTFVVMAYQSTRKGKGYEVKVAMVREMDTDPDWNGIIPGVNDDKKKKGKAKEDDDKEGRTTAIVRKVTPYKARDLVPLVRGAVSANPTLSNKKMRVLLEPYGKVEQHYSVFTDSLLQNTRRLAKEEVFGDPKTNFVTVQQEEVLCMKSSSVTVEENTD